MTVFLIEGDQAKITPPVVVKRNQLLRRKEPRRRPTMRPWEIKIPLRRPALEA
jgi:hypothetical protein